MRSKIDVAARVRSIIANRLPAGAPPVSDEDTLLSLGIESLDKIEILFEIEEEFNINLPLNGNTQDNSPFEDVGSLIAYVCSFVEYHHE